MKALGKGSVSSVMVVMVNVAFVLIGVVLIATCAAVVFSGFAGAEIVSVIFETDGSPNVEIGPNVHMAIPVSFDVDSQRLPVRAPSLGIADGEIRNAQATLRFRARNGAFFVANLTLVIVMLALALWILTQLRGLFGALRDGQPFAPKNATRVRRIGWTIIGAEVLGAVVFYAEHLYAATYFAADGLRFNASPRLNAFAIISGCIVLVLAEVFRVGARLDEEQALTV